MEFNRRPPCRRPLVPYSHAVSRALAATSFLHVFLCTIFQCAFWHLLPQWWTACSRHLRSTDFRPSSSACPKSHTDTRFAGRARTVVSFATKRGPSCSAAYSRPSGSHPPLLARTTRQCGPPPAAAHLLHIAGNWRTAATAAAARATLAA